MSGPLTVEHRCPQCGAPILLHETDRLLACRYCRVRLFIVAQGSFRYYLPPPSEAEEMLFAPYVRFRAMEFTCTDAGIQTRVVDLTWNATTCQALPDCLGLRPQAMKLHFLYSAPSLQLLKEDPSARHLPKAVGEGAKKESGVLLCRYVGMSTSIIYAPFYIRDGMLYDGLLDRSLQKGRIDGPFEDHTDLRVAFLPTLCPECGWQMQADRQSCVVLCTSCCRAWLPGIDSFQQVSCGVIDKPFGADLYLPFWKMKAQVSGLDLVTYADLVRYGNLPKVLPPEMVGRAVSFWIPAFKIRPDIFLRVARHLTVAQPDGGAVAEFKRRTLYPVTLPAEQASEFIGIVLADIGHCRDEAVKVLAEARIQEREPCLVYLPFVRRAGDLVHPELGFAIDLAALKFGACI